MPLSMRPTAVACLALLVSAVIRVTGASSDSKYDFGTTIFSPKGRIYQVEYAAEAVNRARPAIGICTNEGVVLCSLKTVHNTRLQAANHREKTNRIDAHIICASAGLTADAMVLVKDCRASAQQHFLAFQERIPVQKLAAHVADVKQAYTQHGGLRPWGVSMLLAGWDISRGVQLYRTDCSGTFDAFKAVAVGAGASRIAAELASEYARDGGAEMGLAKAVRLAVRVMDGERSRGLAALGRAAESSDTLRGIGMEVATVAVREGGEAGPEASVHIYDDSAVDKLRRSSALNGQGDGNTAEDDDAER